MPLPFLAGAAAVRGIVTAARYMPKVMKAVGRGTKKVGKAAVSPGAMKGEIAFAGATEMKDAQAKKKNKLAKGKYQKKLGKVGEGSYQRKLGKVGEGSYKKLDKKKKK